MRWYARYEMEGDPDLGQQELIGEDEGVVAVHPDSEAKAVDVILAFEAPDYAHAPRLAAVAFSKLTNVRELLDNDVLSDPYRITIEAPLAPPRPPGMLSTSAVAQRLGWSEARVRQMKGTLGFPTALKIPGAAGDFYLIAQVNEYRRQREEEAARAHRDPGRPRATDEAQMDSALTFLSNYPGLSDEDAHLVANALRAKGGRSVRGKARVLVDVFNRHNEELAGEFGSNVGMAEWLRRASEIAGD